MKQAITNRERLRVIRLLRKKAREHKCALWRHVSDRLEASKSRRVTVNLSRINRYTQQSDIAVVAGKALSSGELSHSLTIAAFDFSEKTREKTHRAGGRCITLEELLAENPSGTNVKLIG